MSVQALHQPKPVLFMSVQGLHRPTINLLHVRVSVTSGKSGSFQALARLALPLQGLETLVARLTSTKTNSVYALARLTSTKTKSTLAPCKAYTDTKWIFLASCKACKAPNRPV